MKVLTDIDREHRALCNTLAAALTRAEKAGAEVAQMRKALLATLPLLEEECRPGSPLLRMVYNALQMNEHHEGSR